MAGGLKHVRTRIKAIRNIRKITKAMELVSVSKMRRSVSAVLASRPYAQLCWNIVRDLSKITDATIHPLLFTPEKMERVLIVIITADRGLCGNFNGAIVNQTERFIKQLPADATVTFVTIGKKAQDIAARRKWNIIASFTNLSVSPNAVDIMPITLLLRNTFLKRECDHVYITYTDFVSTVKQRPVIHQLLPIKEIPGLGEVSATSHLTEETHVLPSHYNVEFLFEPKRDTVLEFVLPRIIEIEVYQAILESIASEHSARMLAMKNATDAASDIVDDLTFSFNQLRQSVITREIAEISAGKAVLEG